MKSPYIIFPQNILDPHNKKCMFIRCGDFIMKSELPPRQVLGKNYELSNVREELFDIYKMKIMIKYYLVKKIMIKNQKFFIWNLK